MTITDIAHPKPNLCFANLDERNPNNPLKFSWATDIGRRDYQQDTAFLSVREKIENPEEYLRDIFAQMTEDNSHEDVGGSTAAAYYFDAQEGTITTANLGDSRVIVIIKDNSKHADKDKFISILLTEDHKVTLPRIQEHIIKNGGKIEFCQNDWRVNGNLNMGGVIADAILGDAVLRNPDIATFKIKELIEQVNKSKNNKISTNPNDLELIIINSSDGLTNHIRDDNYDYNVVFAANNQTTPPKIEKSTSLWQKPYDISILVAKNILSSNLSETLVKEANRELYPNDNTTVTICHCKLQEAAAQNRKVVGVVFDGHVHERVAINCMNIMERDFVEQNKRLEPEEKKETTQNSKECAGQFIILCESIRDISCNKQYPISLNNENRSDREIENLENNMKKLNAEESKNFKNIMQLIGKEIIQKEGKQILESPMPVIISDNEGNTYMMMPYCLDSAKEFMELVEKHEINTTNIIAQYKEVLEFKKNFKKENPLLDISINLDPNREIIIEFSPNYYAADYSSNRTKYFEPFNTFLESHPEIKDIKLEDSFPYKGCDLKTAIDKVFQPKFEEKAAPSISPQTPISEQLVTIHKNNSVTL